MDAGGRHQGDTGVVVVMVVPVEEATTEGLGILNRAELYRGSLGGTSKS